MFSILFCMFGGRPNKLTSSVRRIAIGHLGPEKCGDFRDTLGTRIRLMVPEIIVPVALQKKKIHIR